MDAGRGVFDRRTRSIRSRLRRSVATARVRGRTALGNHARLRAFHDRSTVDLKDLTRSMVLRLADDEPIRARILNLEGRPIAGVRIDAVGRVSQQKGMDRSLARRDPPERRLLRNRPPNGRKGHPQEGRRPIRPGISRSFDGDGSLGRAPSAVTDAAGKVEIRGLGRERLVMLKIVGPGIAAAKVFALTHARRKRSNLNRGSGPISSERFFPFNGPDLRLHCRSRGL